MSEIDRKTIKKLQEGGLLAYSGCLSMKSQNRQRAIPVNRCTPPRRSNLISLRGIKMAFLITS